MPTLLFYTTAGCHLCEQAVTLIYPICQRLDWQIETIDIADSTDLIQRYGTRIPVVSRHDTGLELGWPFTSEEVSRLLSD